MITLRDLLVQAPVVTFAGTNWAVSGGTVLSVVGINFGIDSGSPTALVAADHCSTTSWASATTVLCTASASLAVTNAVSVRVMQVAGSHAGMITFDGTEVLKCRTVFFWGTLFVPDEIFYSCVLVSAKRKLRK